MSARNAPHPEGTPFRNGLLPDKEVDPTLHHSGKISDHRGADRRPPNIGSMPSGVPSGTLDKITPSKGSV